ncbi:hypothetical protein BamIOP4010DRAFT_3000 [Burkholderia ambifaria IOP40-10]|uniref:Uncharacterized protein n=1 Tax=Burkholderia ambifaria IOP40-10 TaxID=396596 RepID=B1FG40_9BURK|nr:hypothetical protein [Burkholderia ambifaria]EDT03471.1 hypothetical protein BamIOP4010DRAFT_3000 [Burkholderia ambifaria IOP40-10]
MAASEVVVAASQVAATVAQAPVNWVGVVASSAAIGAVVNNAMTLLVRHFDRKREDATLAARRAHVQLEVALALEGFAHRASTYLYALAPVRSAYQSGDERASENLGVPHLQFDLAPDAAWSELPIQIIATIRELPSAFQVTDNWIESIYDGWDDLLQVLDLREQQAIHYGLLACELAQQIRDEIQVPRSALVADYQQLFEARFRALVAREGFAPNDLDVLPELARRLASTPAGLAVAGAS